MSSRYDDRDRDRNQRNYGRRSAQEYDRSSQSGWNSSFNDEDERYAGESNRQYGTGRALYRGGGDYESSDWGTAGEGDRYSSERDRSQGRGGYSGGGYGGSGYSGSSRGYGGGSRGYGSSSRGESGRSGGEYGNRRLSNEYGSGYDRSTGEEYGGATYGDEYGSNYGGGFERGEARYRDTSGGYSQRSSYPGQSFGQTGRSYGDPGRARYGEGRQYGQDRDWYEDRAGYENRGGYEDRSRYEGRGGYENRGGYGERDDRGWWDRLSDTVASWFGDEEAERRRRLERPYEGRGPKGYRRSDDRIKEDVNDRLSEGYLDASDIEVSVSGGELVLTGTVNSRSDKRRAEAIAENVSGVLNVENRLRVRNRQQYDSTYGTSEGTSSMGTTGSTGTGTSSTGLSNPGTTGTGATGAGTTGAGTDTGLTGTGTTGGATGTTGSSSSSARGKTAGS